MKDEFFIANSLYPQSKSRHFAAPASHRFLVELNPAQFHAYFSIRVRILKPAPNGSPGFSEGAIIEINGRTIEPERFVTRVAQMDMTGINLIAHKGPIQFGNLHHTFTETPEGPLYQSRLVIGSTIPVLGKILTVIVKKQIFTPEMGRTWFKHNIEEVGNFEFFLPSLYAERAVAA